MQSEFWRKISRELHLKTKELRHPNVFKKSNIYFDWDEIQNHDCHDSVVKILFITLKVIEG